MTDLRKRSPGPARTPHESTACGLIGSAVALQKGRQEACRLGRRKGSGEENLAMPKPDPSPSKIGAVLRATGGNFLEMFDFFLFGIYAAPIGKAFFATGSEFTDTMIAFIVFWIGALMRPLGAIYLGAYV